MTVLEVRTEGAGFPIDSLRRLVFEFEQELVVFFVLARRRLRLVLIEEGLGRVGRMEEEEEL